VLGLKPGLRPPGPNPGQGDRNAPRDRQGEGGAEDLAATLAVGAVQDQQTGCSLRIKSAWNSGIAAPAMLTPEGAVQSRMARRPRGPARLRGS
jgi:hypothetical protein